MPVFNQSRSNIIRLIFAGMFLIIIAQLFHLQIVSKKYKVQAQENALFRKSVYPPPAGSSTTIKARPSSTIRSCMT